MVSVVQKAFDGPGGEIRTGTIVDSTGWKNEMRLHNCRFLRPATETEAAEFRAGRTAPPAARKPARSRKVH